MLCPCATLTEASCICVFVYLYLGKERVVVGEWIVDVISFQKIFGLCCLKCHIVEIWRDVTFEDRGRTRDGQRKCEYRARIREAGLAKRPQIELYCDVREVSDSFYVFFFL